MTKVTFSVHDGFITGFHITGHSSRSSRDEEGRIVCSAVSSAAYLVANTVTDVIGASADAAADDGDMHLEIRSHLFRLPAHYEGHGASHERTGFTV